MEFPVSYDITRLGSRVFSASPNGIHRVDATLARYFLSRRDPHSGGTWYPWPLAHRVLGHRAAIEVLDAVDTHFAERDDPSLEPLFLSIRNWLLGNDGGAASAPQRLRRRGDIGLSKVIGWALRHGLDLRATAARSLPKGARYINVSHYGLSVPGAFDWLASRPDVKAVFFVHDMLPLEAPEYFVAREFARHQNRMRNLARHGAGAIVSTDIVKAALRSHLARLGRPDLPILTARLPVAPIFFKKAAPEPDLSARPFFIQCGTIEPRKNHLMILQVWRELAARHGFATPKLLIVGMRGWENENTIDLIDRSPALRGKVLEVSGLPTPVLRRLLCSARALLMPSFAEGFGLPVAEAIAAGAPVIASDLPVFREIAGDAFLAISPIDGKGWLHAIEQFALETADRRHPRALRHVIDNSDAFFESVESFIGSL